MWADINFKIISFAFYIFKIFLKINVNSIIRIITDTIAQYMFLPRNYFQNTFQKNK